MNRRGFLGSILAACAAPAIVRADSLMRIVPQETLVLVGDQWNEAVWTGAVREWSAFDIRLDEQITRFDVMARDRYGVFIQHGVDIRTYGAPTKEDRNRALDFLRRGVEGDGGRPVRGVLKIDQMDMAQCARFI